MTGLGQEWLIRLRLVIAYRVYCIVVGAKGVNLGRPYLLFGVTWALHHCSFSRFVQPWLYSISRTPHRGCFSSWRKLRVSGWWHPSHL